MSLVLWVLRASLVPLHQRWTEWDGAYAHGYPLLLICLLFFVRDLQPRLHFAKAYWGYVPLVLVPALLWSFGYATQLGVVQQMALPVLLACLILPRLGLRQLLSLLGPLLLFYLAIPLWELLLPTLRTMTSHVATLGVRLVGVPAYIDGFTFVLPYGAVEIAGSCAGLNYLLMGLVLASINSRYRHFDLRYTFLSIGLMALLAIVSNWLRVYSLILIAYYSQMKSPLVYDHGNFGWWLFAVVFCLFLWLIRRVPESPTRMSDEPNASPLRLPSSGTFVLLSTAVLALAFPLYLLTQVVPNSELHRNAANPALPPGWVSVSVALANSQYRPSYAGYDQASFWQTRVADRTWLIGQLVYQHQQQGKELISQSNSLVRGQNTAQLLAPLAGNSGVAAVRIGGKTPRLVLYTHQVGKRLTLATLNGKLAQFSELLAGRSAVALWYATTTCSSYQCQAELATLTNEPATLDRWLKVSALY
ncbi:exosortase [Reinekea sp.]|jgi:exosortase|uniref:exosortase n=1 Tax=Reinekea sp. TaxID=1970455 RepID=UPI002A7EEFEC|nr:exosortase [Reinekea sp.]